MKRARLIYIQLQMPLLPTMIIINCLSLHTYILVYFIREDKEKYNMSLKTEMTRKFSGQSPVIVKFQLREEMCA